ncbi:MAG: hypothetical protein NCW75_07655 [Phycisphaera sp.]|nr:MAG: hypothetical protein NCW75_07655 [Phycisphaera sp.]
MKRSILSLSVGMLVLGVGMPAFGQLAPPPGGQQAQQPAFEKIYTVDDDGAPIAPDTWLDIAALTANPTLSVDQRESIEEGVRAWLADIQNLVIENPDLALEAAKGLFETIDIEERAGLAYASEVMKALGSTTKLSSYLTTEGVLTNEQGETNRQIVQDYARARSEHVAQGIMAEAAEDQQRQMQLLMARTTMTSLTDDALRMFRSVAVRGAPNARAAVEAAGLDASAYSSELAAVQQASSDEARIDAMIALMDSMEDMDLFKFSKALGEKLPPIKLPEMARVGTAKAPEPDDG